MNSDDLRRSRNIISLSRLQGVLESPRGNTVRKGHMTTGPSVGKQTAARCRGSVRCSSSGEPGYGLGEQLIACTVQGRLGEHYMSE
jgi:hypothetical protein